MDAITAGIMGGANLIGGILNNDANEELADKAAAFNADEAYKNRAWQEKMANTRYEMAIGDLRHMKMNPLLALGGQPPTAGGGASASMQAARAENVISPAISSALEGSKLNTVLENTKSQTAVNDAIVKTNETQQAKNVADAVTSAKQAQKINAETIQINKGQHRAEGQNKLEGWLFDKINSYLDTDAKTVSEDYERAVNDAKNNTYTPNKRRLQ